MFLWSALCIACSNYLRHKAPYTEICASDFMVSCWIVLVKPHHWTPLLLLAALAVDWLAVATTLIV